MPYGILVDDIIPLCCYLVHGDVTRSLSNLIEAVYELQERSDAGVYFGNGPQDSEGAIREQARLNRAGTGDGASFTPHGGPLALHRTTVYEMVPRML